MILLNAAPVRIASAELVTLADVLIVNAIESERLAHGSVVGSLEGALAPARRLTAVCPAAIVTAGGEGVAFADRQGRLIAIRTEEIKAESTRGAGDEFLGALAAADTSIDAALQPANRAAALLVSTPEDRRV